jgi:mRNA-degrading endonuclease toxin of MazEF toxin-antitoxin module
LLPAGIAGLKKAGIALCHQVMTLDRAKLPQSLGMLTGEYLEEVATGLKAAMDLR